MKTIKPPIRHSRAGGNPALTNIPRSGQSLVLSCCAGNDLIVWIPACAGMTQFLSMDKS
jgi:hypothetical protein